MLNLDEINEEIAALEANGETTYAVIQRLAPLYIVRNNLIGASAKSVDGETSDQTATPFMQVVSKCDISKVMVIIDELMSTIQFVNPKLYEAVMRKINEI